MDKHQFIESQGFSTSEPTNQLKFIIRDGEKILQQLWHVTSYDPKGRAYHQDGDWQDVPLETDGE